MLSSVLQSERAVRVNIAIMRAFVKLREMLETNREFGGKVHSNSRAGSASTMRRSPRSSTPFAV